MKRLLVCAAILVFSIIAAPHTQAHILKTDGTVGATIHISPDDDPIVAEPATFFFDFKDTAEKFSLEDCLCSVHVTQNGKQIYSAPLSSDSMVYTFPARGIYSIAVSGKPKTSDTFTPFTLRYDIRVTKVAAASAPQQNNIGNYIRFGVIIATLFFFLVLIVSGRRTKKITVKKKQLMIAFLVGTVSMLHLCHVIKPLIASHHHSSHHEEHQPCCIPLASAVIIQPSLTPHAALSSVRDSSPALTPLLSIHIVENIRPPPVS